MKEFLFYLFLLPRWRKLAACAQFKIYNSLCRPHSHPSHYSHCSHCSHNRSPQIAQLQHFPPFERGVGGNVTLFPSPSHNSKFIIQNSLPVPPMLIASILNSLSPLIHYTFSVSLAQPAFLAFSLSRGVKPFFVFLIGIKDKMVTSSSVSSSGSSSSSSSLVLFQVTSLT